MLHRKAFYLVQRALEYHNVVILVGIRKTGKTTILTQLADVMNGMYIDCRAVRTSEDSYYQALAQKNKDLLLLDEACYMEDFDLILSTADQDCSRNNKKLVITSSSYDSMKQLATEGLGGGRSTVIELFPLSFEEFLLFSNKIKCYNEEYVPTEQDVEEFFCLKGIPEGLRLVLDVSYLDSVVAEADVAASNYYNEQRNYPLDASQVRATLDIIAYTLNYRMNIKRLGRTRIGVQEFSADSVRDMNLTSTIIYKSNAEMNLNKRLNSRISTIHPMDVAKILLFLLNNGFLFIDAVRNEYGSQPVSEVNRDLLCVSSKFDLSAIFKKYIFSPISPLLYTRLKIDLEMQVDLASFNSHLRGDMFELAIKSEDIYNQGFSTIHYSEKVRYGEIEVDLYSYSGILLESAIGVKGDNNLLKVMRDAEIARVLTCGIDKEEPISLGDGYYKIHYPLALLMLSNRSMYELEPSSQHNMD